MSFDVNTWIKQKITPLFDEIKPIRNDGFSTSHGNLWSLKKEVALHLYIPSYYNIIKNYFDKWYYFDPFCGSGLFDFTKPSILKDVRFPGSPIISLSHYKKYPFHEYFLSDKSEISSSVLKTRINKLYGLNIDVKTTDFQSSISSVENIDARTGHESCLAVIDPVGYKTIPWENMERLLKIETCDLFIVVMTSDLHRNLPIALNPELKGDQGLTNFLGNDSWNGLETGEDIVKQYRKQIAEFGKYTEVLSVNRVGETKIYDIILSTRSPGGMNAMKDIAERLKHVTTENIRPQAIFGSGKMKPLDEYFKW